MYSAFWDFECLTWVVFRIFLWGWFVLNLLLLLLFFVLVFFLYFFFLVECRPGSYGSNCSLNCSSYCENKACDRSSGECLYGCTPGYQKPDCVMRKICIKFSCFALLLNILSQNNHNRFVVQFKISPYVHMHYKKLE